MKAKGYPADIIWIEATEQEWDNWLEQMVSAGVFYVYFDMTDNCKLLVCLGRAFGVRVMKPIPQVQKK